MKSLNELNWYEKRIFKDICRKAVIQGDHQYYITEFFLSLIEQSLREFSEDNIVTHEDFLQECFEDALKKSRPNAGLVLKDHRWFDAVLIDGQKTRFNEKYADTVEHVLEDTGLPVKTWEDLARDKLHSVRGILSEQEIEMVNDFLKM